MATLASLIHDTADFLAFLKSRYHLYHCSNIFFRDVQYGIMAYAEHKGVHLSYTAGEELARQIITQLTGAGILRAVRPGSWMLNYDSFRKPSTKSEVVPAVRAAAQPAKLAASTTQADHNNV